MLVDPPSEHDLPAEARTGPAHPALPVPPVCPVCHGSLRPTGAGMDCPACPAGYPLGEHGFVEFGTAAGGARETGPRLEGYAGHQEDSGERRYRDYLLPWARSNRVHTILDAGCGVGVIAECFTHDGFDAYGVDLPKAARFWAAAGRSPERFFCADATRLPFADSSFDAALSMGVIEHIGTITGHCTLAHDHRRARADYARELVRVLKPGGRLLVSCPNKTFPVDIHHGPGDALTQPGRLRREISTRAGLNVHRTWGSYHLMSLAEVRDLFLGAGASRVTALPARGYFAFDGIAERLPKALAGPGTSAIRAYVERLPSPLRGTPLDPFVLAEVSR